jgi:hypothetical protein
VTTDLESQAGFPQAQGQFQQVVMNQVSVTGLTPTTTFTPASTTWTFTPPNPDGTAGVPVTASSN